MTATKIGAEAAIAERLKEWDTLRDAKARALSATKTRKR